MKISPHSHVGIFRYICILFIKVLNMSSKKVKRMSVTPVVDLPEELWVPYIKDERYIVLENNESVENLLEKFLKNISYLT